MGLESHIQRVLEEKAPKLIFGEDYWFENGLKANSHQTALRICQALGDTGEFGPTRMAHDPKDEDAVLIEFGKWREKGVHSRCPMIK